MDLHSPPTRRELLQRGGFLAGALAVGSWSVPPAGAAPAAGAAVALTEERRRTYAALAETFLTAPGMRLPASAAEQALRDFEAVYAGWPTAERRHADLVLDDLGRDARMENSSQRAAVMRGSNPRDAEIAYRARGLVAVALASESGDHAEVSV